MCKLESYGFSVELLKNMGGANPLFELWKGGLLGSKPFFPTPHFWHREAGGWELELLEYILVKKLRVE